MFKWIGGLIAGIFMDRKGRVVILGLENAGKTTLLNLIAHDKLVAAAPTKTTWTEEVKVGGISMKVMDVGGHSAVRRIWRKYIHGVDGIVFVVDAKSVDDFELVRGELDKLLADEYLDESVPFAILGNKVDLPGAVSEHELSYHLGISDQRTGKKNFNLKQRPIELFMCSMVKKAGFKDAFQWLASSMAAK